MTLSTAFLQARSHYETTPLARTSCQPSLPAQQRSSSLTALEPASGSPLSCSSSALACGLCVGFAAAAASRSRQRRSKRTGSVVRLREAKPSRDSNVPPTDRLTGPPLKHLGEVVKEALSSEPWARFLRRKQRLQQRDAAPQAFMPGDTRMGGLGQSKPGCAWDLASRAFNRELEQLILALEGSQGPLAKLREALRNLSKGEEPDSPPLVEPPAVVAQLHLDVDAVVRREEERGVPESTPVVQVPFYSLCWLLDRLYEGRPIAKFWVLETVARLPYFSYVSVLHLYESLGWWRTPQLRSVHDAESHNELHHLLVMESLGGDAEWFDRFLAEHAAILYYWFAVVLFMLHPPLAYNFSLLVEEHAFVTYSQFVEENRELLARIPPPPVAVRYYTSGQADEISTTRNLEEPPRVPPCENMLDVFRNIRDDELEHINTMKSCQDWFAGSGPAPLQDARLESLGSREEWQKWSEAVNRLDVH
eukprot:TRINITY_DN73198_c0_g1_i1.p1 TRINITY_DN73198_c0_g1~~TRINITY_DN73198_c0_g1_i1.p1  ORF type:complete len:477 (-),score=120.65 TRINITY_DN73198_c0_g1_i1:191-1621(-)